MKVSLAEKAGTTLRASPPSAGLRLMPRTPALWAAYAILGLLLALPMLLVEVPMGVDTLNHLARIHVQAHLTDDADLARLFEVREGLIPYMGLDWALTPLARAMPTLVAARVFIVLLLWSTVGAVVALQRAFTGRVGFEPLLMGLVSYNALLAWGFLNYLLGLVGALLGFAAWHAMRKRPWGTRLLLFTAVATLMYFVHLLALALYGVILGAYEVFGRRRAWQTPARDWALLGLQFVPAAVLWLQLPMPASGGLAGLTWLPAAKPTVLASPFLFSGAAGGLDAGLAAFALSGFLLLRLTRTGALRLTRELAAPAAVLAVLGLVAPDQLLGVSFIDVRFPAAAACLAVAALCCVPDRSRQLVPAVLATAMIAAVQVGSAATTMRACDRQYSELRAALAAVPQGVVLTSFLEYGSPQPGLPCTGLPVYVHMPQLVTIERSGYSPDFFAAVTSVAVRNGLPTDTDPADAASLASTKLAAGTYVLWMHLGNTSRPIPPELVPLHDGSFFKLLAVR